LLSRLLLPGPARSMATALQRQRAMHLYRHSLKAIISWAVRREIFYEEVDRLRAEFEGHKYEVETGVIDALLVRGEKRLHAFAHPDPYIVPYAFGGTLYERNPPQPHMEHVMDFGREK